MMIDAKYVDKSDWGDGPWQGEPDRKEWTDKETGLSCLALRNERMGHWCGYVAVPPTHPAYGLSYDGVPQPEHEAHMATVRAAMGEAYKVQSDDPRDKIMAMTDYIEQAGTRTEPAPDSIGQRVRDLDAHGGLTYANSCGGNICHKAEEGQPDTVWWFGFDCAHAWDMSPGMNARSRKLPGYNPEWSREDVYRTLEYVEQECAALARQLHALS